MAPWLSTMIKWMWTTGSNTMIFWPTLFTGIRWDLLNNTNAKCLGQLLQIITLTNNSLFSTKKVYHYQLCIGPPLFYPQCAIFFCKGKKMESLPAFSFLTFYLAFLNKITSQSLDTNFFHEKLGWRVALESSKQPRSREQRLNFSPNYSQVMKSLSLSIVPLLRYRLNGTMVAIHLVLKISWYQIGLIFAMFINTRVDTHWQMVSPTWKDGDHCTNQSL